MKAYSHTRKIMSMGASDIGALREQQEQLNRKIKRIENDVEQHIENMERLKQAGEEEEAVEEFVKSNLPDPTVVANIGASRLADYNRMRYLVDLAERRVKQIHEETRT